MVRDDVTDRPGAVPGPAVPRRWLVTELWLVFALSLGASCLRALISLVADALTGVPLSAQTAVLNASLAPGRPWLDLVLQLFGLAFALVPVLLASASLIILSLFLPSRANFGLIGTQHVADEKTTSVAR